MWDPRQIKQGLKSLAHYPMHKDILILTKMVFRQFFLTVFSDYVQTNLVKTVHTTPADASAPNTFWAYFRP